VRPTDSRRVMPYAEALGGTVHVEVRIGDKSFLVV
jgi:hypothetical protein